VVVGLDAGTLIPGGVDEQYYLAVWIWVNVNLSL